MNVILFVDRIFVHFYLSYTVRSQLFHNHFGTWKEHLFVVVSKLLAQVIPALKNDYNLETYDMEKNT